MSSFLALRCLGKSLKYSPSIKCCQNLLKHKLNCLPATFGVATNSNTSLPNPIISSNDEWRIIYRMPLITWASAFNRVKIPYGILNMILIPAAFALEIQSQLQPPMAMLITSIGVTSCCTLVISSAFIQNIIGIIYINDNNDKLKLAYIDYWGKRNDVCIAIDDIVPESEKTNPSKVDFYQSLCLYSDNKVKYILLQRFGKIEDLETFASIFGE